MRLLLCGNPNSGKSTLFNRLCGAHRQTGNFAGVTVDAAEGSFSFGGEQVTVVDLPGMYTLAAEDTEERVAADALRAADGVLVQVADASAAARALYLTAALAALGRPMVLALNMADEMERRGTKLDVQALTRLTGIPAVLISARRGEGIDALLAAAREAPPARGWFDAQAVADAVVTEGGGGRGVCRDDRIDRIVLRPYVGLPLAALLIAAALFLSFGTVGAALRDGFCTLLAACVRAPVARLCADLAIDAHLASFLLDGVCAGVLGVLGFLPQVALLFLCLSVFEDSGLAARMAFLCHPLLTRFGLSGRSLFPLCVGFGCTVPAVMAARVAPARERRVLCFCLPFVCCPARAPVFALILAALFPAAGFLPLLLLYLLGISAALVAAAVLSRGGGAAEKDFIMELVPYRLPHPRTLLAAVLEKCRDFLLRAGTLIFLASAAVWLLESLGPHGFAASVEDSFLFRLGSLAAKPLTPLGFGNATAASALLLGFFAKETIVSTLGVLAGDMPLAAAVRTLFTPASAAAFLVFSLLYTPCLATCAVLRRECGACRTAAVVAFDLAFAYAAAWLTRAVAGLFC